MCICPESDTVRIQVSSQNGSPLRISSRTPAIKSVARLALTTLSAAGLIVSTAVAPAAAADPVLSASVEGIITLPAADGFKDTATLSISSDTAVTVRPEIVDGTNAVVKELGDVQLLDGDSNGSFTATVPLQALDVAAGAYTVKVTETVGGIVAATAPLTVGSGKVVWATLAASPKFYPYKDGYLDTLKATVTAFDETDTAVPFSGSVQVKSGTTSRKSNIASPTGAKAFALVSVVGFPSGAGSVVAKVHGPTAVDFTTDPRPVRFDSTRVTTVTVSKNISTVYPADDDYRDTVTFKAVPQTSTGTRLPVTGKVVISLSGKTVKSWSFSTSATKSFTWNGLNAGRIVPGKYTVKVSAKGPQGSTKTAVVDVNVSAKRLVTKAATRYVNAKPVFKGYEDYSASGLGSCSYDAAEVVWCEAYGLSDDGVALYAYGSFTVPEYVLEHSASVRVTANVDYVYGDVAWNYYYDDARGVDAELVTRGNNTLDWLKLSKSTRKVYVDFGLADYADVEVDYFKIEYRYKALQ